MRSASRRFGGRPPRDLPRLPLVLPVVAALAVVSLVGVPSWAHVGRTGSTVRPGPVARLQVFSRPPVLVQAGAPVRIPVDVVCATVRARPCPASVSIHVLQPVRGWRGASARARPGLAFDLGAAAASGSSAVPYRIAVRAGGSPGADPAHAAGRRLQYYVTSDMPSLSVPSVPFGQTASGTVALYLPWGSGPDAAGLAPGVESSTMGPSSFDVDRRGQIALADPLQGRVAFFAAGRLVRQTGLPLGPRTDVAFADDASTYVTSLTPQFTTSVARIDSRGRVASSSRIGSLGDEPSEIRSAGSAAFVHVLPADAWESASSAIPGPPSVGRPLPGGSQLLKVVDGNAVRLGTVVGARVQDAVELDFQTNVAELALAEPDGHHGYWAVVHVWQESPTQADQYQVVHVDSALHVTTFAVPAEEFAETMPLSRFRLGGDGGLYELTSSADGIRIVRYDLGGNR